ncbi:MAG TPA: baseplate J/gp47 family protein [Candidatus Acidoferrales bacterium]|nr:baseplate J/gp47 family protein [Candidatus Acidoferrales bacterium]
MTQPCGCCEPGAPLVPLPEENRPGLSAIAYRIGTYASFRETMLDAIAGAPELAALSTRQSDDYSVTFLELWAAVLDVLTFYQERYANEVFLRTAQQPASLQRLARLLDYSPRPGVAALDDLAFTIDAGRVVDIPAGLRVQSVPQAGEQPQTFETLEAITADARFNRLRVYPAPATLNPLAQASTEAELDALKGPALAAALSPNDPVVLFNDGGSDPVEEKKIAALAIADGRVTLRWTTPVQGGDWTATTQAYKFRRTFRLYGYNAPASFMLPVPTDNAPGGLQWNLMTTDFSNPGGNTLALDGRYGDLAAGTQLLVVAPTNPVIAPVDGLAAVEAAAEAQAAMASAFFGAGFGSGMILNRLSSIDINAANLGTILDFAGVQTILVTVTQTDQAGVSVQGKNQPANTTSPISDTVTQVTVQPVNSQNTIGSIDDIRGAVVYELVGDPITFRGAVYPDQLTSATVYLPGVLAEDERGLGIEVNRTIQQNAFVPGVVLHPEDLDVGREVLLLDDAGLPIPAAIQSPAAIVAAAGAGPGAFAHLVVPLTADSVALETASAVLLGNVARASHGETVRNEVLGNGDASQTFQRFTLQKQPLTYVPGSGPGGVTSSLQLAVNRVSWSETPELYAQPPTAQVYSTRQTDAGKTLVQFGDGNAGAVLPTGSGNVVATYRIGSGLAGRVGANSLTTLLDRLQYLNAVTNPLAADGGADPESPDAVRQNAPRTVRTFGRAVSLRDFEDLITSSGEVAKALATWVWDGLAPAVHLTVAGQEGGTFSDLASLGNTLANARDPNFRLLLGNYGQVPILVAAKLWVDPAYAQADVLSAAQQALLAGLAFDQLSLGQTIHLSQIYLLLQGVAGVTGVEVTLLGFKRPAGMSDSDFQAYLDSRNVTRLADGAVAPVQTNLRIFSARPDPANPGRVLPAEMARIETPSQDVTITAQNG